ncbi:MAG: SHOCT domain-containing protein [Pseudomonadota bacterium]
MGNWGEFGWWGMGFGFLFMILFWVLIILGIVALVRWLTMDRAQERRVSPRDRTPLEIVQERYARGEIDREEYAQKRRDLET